MVMTRQLGVASYGSTVHDGRPCMRQVLQPRTATATDFKFSIVWTLSRRFKTEDMSRPLHGAWCAPKPAHENTPANILPSADSKISPPLSWREKAAAGLEPLGPVARHRRRQPCSCRSWRSGSRPPQYCARPRQTTSARQHKRCAEAKLLRCDTASIRGILTLGSLHSGSLCKLKAAVFVVATLPVQICCFENCHLPEFWRLAPTHILDKSPVMRSCKSEKPRKRSPVAWQSLYSRRCISKSGSTRDIDRLAQKDRIKHE